MSNMQSKGGKGMFIVGAITGFLIGVAFTGFIAARRINEANEAKARVIRFQEKLNGKNYNYGEDYK